jgi:GntR family transcriptional regulator, transcriptional repressor for pyruvate dehydrogenase complex
MALRAVEKRSLADGVFEQLMTEIVSGRCAPGEMIPSERDLSEVFSVNRHVVREAVKRLQQVGLLCVVQGGRTKVLDFRRAAGLDLLAIVAEHAEHAEAVEGLLPLLAAALEMRAGIGVDVARLCAQRAGSDVRGELLEISEGIAVLAEGAELDGTELLALDRHFWQRVLDGAGNLAYQLAFNSLIRAVHVQHDFSVTWLEQELKRGDYRRPIAAAIAAGDPEGAATAARLALAPDERGPLFAQSREPARVRR